MTAMTALQPRVPLSQHSSLKVGGPADWYGEPRDEDALRSMLAEGRERGLTIKIIGGGSNILVHDDGIEGLVLRPIFHGFRVEREQGIVEAMAGASLGGLARSLAKQGWSGLEWAATVPGCVGGAVVNNAGAFGSSIAESLLSADLLLDTGVRVRLAVEELAYAYRTSKLKRGEIPGAVVLSARFRVTEADPVRARQAIQELQDKRGATQPRLLSAGSVFANPPGDFSGRLLEAAGAKGMRVGDAEISTLHANFIVNHGRATARDVYTLMTRAQMLVRERTGIVLVPEIELAGRWTNDERAQLSEEGMPPC